MAWVAANSVTRRYSAAGDEYGVTSISSTLLPLSTPAIPPA